MLDPLRNQIQIRLHVIHLIRIQLDHPLSLVRLLDLLLEHSKNLTIQILLYLLLSVATLLQPIEQLGVIAPQKHDQVEPALREEVTGVELQDDAASLRHQRFQLVAHHVLIELGHVEFLVPLVVELFGVYQLGELDVLEAGQVVVFGQLRLKQ